MKKSKLYRVAMAGMLVLSIAMVAAVVGQFVPAGLPRTKKLMPPRKPAPVERIEKRGPQTVQARKEIEEAKPQQDELIPRVEEKKTELVSPYDEATTRFSGSDFAGWQQLQLEEKTYRVSPVISFGRR